MDAATPFETLAEVTVDEALALQLVRGKGLPRLAILNQSTGKKKHTSLAWAEGQERNLKIKTGRTSTREYPLEEIRAAVARLVDQAGKDLALKSLLWRAVQVFGDLIHRPRSVFNEAECLAVPESKRDTLWLSYAPSPRDPHRVRPCFAETPQETALLDGHRKEGKPWRGIDLLGPPPATLRNLPFVKELIHAEPHRWGSPLVTAAQAILLGFRDWSPDGEQLLGEALWALLPNPESRSEETLTNLLGKGREFWARMTAYLRLVPLLEQVEQREGDDAPGTAEAEGFKRRDRFSLMSRPDQSRMFVVQRYLDGSGGMAFTLVPETRLPGEKDRLLLLQEELWERILAACALGGEPDGQYAATSLVQALEMARWLALVDPLLHPSGPGFR